MPVPQSPQDPSAGPRRDLEDALRESEERLRLAVAAGEVGIWDWDIPGNKVSWSDQVYAMHEMEPGTFGGRVEDFRALIHPDDAARVAGILQKALEAGDTYSSEFRHCLASGEVRWVSTRARIVRDPQGKAIRMVGASTDQTERNALLEAERLARSTAEAARRRIELLASAGALLSGSLEPQETLEAIATSIVPAVADWCRIDLLDEQGVLQRRLAYHSDPAKAAQAWEMVNRLKAAPGTVGSIGWAVQYGQAQFGTFDDGQAPAVTGYTADAAVRTFTQTFGMGAYYILPLIARGRTLGAMAVIQAESGRHIGEDDRALVLELAQRAALALDNARLFAQAEAARREAERANRAKDEFLAMLGHELRNPLAPISSALELMRRRAAGTPSAEREIIERQVTHLTRLVDDLLDVSRVTSGKIRLRRSQVDMKDVISRALELSGPQLGERTRPVELDIDPAPVRVQGDAVRLTQVASNLLANAAKFTPADGHVKVSLRRTAAGIELAVEDSGIGMAADLLPRVFEAFVQGEQPIDRQAGGLGLGLSISRTLVELHGGSIRADSDGPGRGSRFAVCLPEDLSIPVVAPAAGVLSVVSGRGTRVLLVDDNLDALETLTELLRMSGYEARSASDGNRALDVIRTFTPDVALLDVGLPGMDGHELARRLRAAGGMTELKLVALTGYGSERDRAEALAGEFNEHLVKPVSLDQLLQVLGPVVR